MSGERQLRRSNNKIIAGVLGGIAEYLDIDPTAVRVVFTLLTVFTAFSGIIVYILLWLIMPSN